MKLSEWIKDYRQVHGLSMQAMADMCGFSKAYIGVLEKGVNPKTFKPLSPSMQTFKKISDAVGIDINDFIKMLDSDQPITLASAPAPEAAPDFSPHDIALIEAYHDATDEIQDIVDNTLDRYSKHNLPSMGKEERRKKEEAVG